MIWAGILSEGGEKRQRLKKGAWMAHIVSCGSCGWILPQNGFITASSRLTKLRCREKTLMTATLSMVCQYRSPGVQMMCKATRKENPTVRAASGPTRTDSRRHFPQYYPTCEPTAQRRLSRGWLHASLLTPLCYPSKTICLTGTNCPWHLQHDFCHPEIGGNAGFWWFAWGLTPNVCKTPCAYQSPVETGRNSWMRKTVLDVPHERPRETWLAHTPAHPQFCCEFLHRTPSLAGDEGLGLSLLIRLLGRTSTNCSPLRVSVSSS
ncbi:hypothetical protein CI102_7284 [Trichoderma harzianum]|nr:hypothetical protein CI102_7284 [Trichoderma harzianum]